MLVAIPRLAACAKMKTLRLVRGMCARGIEHLLDDGLGAEMSPDQWLEILLPVIADSVRAIDGEAGREGAPQLGRDAAPQAGDDAVPQVGEDAVPQVRPSAAAA